ncbi:hypothetical protein Lal_00038461 [Lupinus albus]|nr:hypothetical protein Lal_00038461 [Lupinus albus]
MSIQRVYSARDSAWRFDLVFFRLVSSGGSTIVVPFFLVTEARLPFAAMPYGDESRTNILLDVALPVFAIGVLCPSIESDSINSFSLGTTPGSLVQAE